MKTNTTKYQLSSASKRWLNTIIKLCLFVLFCVVIYNQISVKNDLAAMWTKFKLDSNHFHLGFLFLCLALLPLNVFLESYKWQKLMLPFQKLSHRASFACILAGGFLSIITPARLGDFAGRMLYVEKGNRIKAILATAIGSLSQHLILISLGVMGFIWMGTHILEIDRFWSYTFLVMSIVVFGLLLLIYFNLEASTGFLQKIAWPEKWKKHIDVLNNVSIYTNKDLLKFVGISAVRFCVYSSQYYLLLHFFGAMIPVDIAFSGIAANFLVQSGIPLPPALSVLLRTEFSLIIWSGFVANPLGIIMATISLWVINLILPAFIGMITMAKTDLLSSITNE